MCSSDLLGKFPARFDDVLGFLTSRISAVFIVIGSAILGMNWKQASKIAKRDNGVTPSPNSGWPMAAAAGALDIRMEKKNSYVINGEANIPNYKDVRNCLRLIEISSILFMLLVILPLFVFAGVNVQIFFENLIVNGIELIRGLLV